MNPRKLCVVTGARAEYGLLRWLMQEIADDPALTLQTVATGMHLSPEFGLTYRHIEKDGFAIDAKVEMLLSSDAPVGVAKSIGLGAIGFADALQKLAPDLVILLGDRFELLSAASAAMALGLPMAHIHGGESSEGAIDEQIRHAITKLAHLHFVAAGPYRRRVIQMGEQPARVWNVGAIGLDNLTRLALLDRPHLEKAIGFSLAEPTFLVTFHPETLGGETSTLALFAALDHFSKAHILFTQPNADAGGRAISEQITAYVARSSGRAASFSTLGQLNYLSTMKHCTVVVGNSSSGIIEAPALKRATVNIGTRQEGRLRASSVIDCALSESAIVAALHRALSSQFQATLDHIDNPYGDGGGAISARIKDTLKTVPLAGLLQKNFYDLEKSVHVG